MATAAIGAVSTGTASAASIGPYKLCSADYILGIGGYPCAYSNGQGNQIGMYGPSQSGVGPSYWYMPAYDSGYGNIQLYGTNLCMQLDASAGYIVIEATCNNITPQKWYFNSSNNSLTNEWNKGQCLTYNEDYERLDTVGCNGANYQYWLLFS